MKQTFKLNLILFVGVAIGIIICLVNSVLLCFILGFGSTQLIYIFRDWFTE
jgi:hypothetical protein